LLLISLSSYVFLTLLVTIHVTRISCEEAPKIGQFDSFYCFLTKSSGNVDSTILGNF